jgi:hypothetical protein
LAPKSRMILQFWWNLVALKLLSNSKFWISATEAFQKTTITEVSSLNRNFGFSYRNFGFSNRNFEFLNWNFGFSNRNFEIFEPKLRVFRTETSGFSNRNFFFLPKTLCFWKPEFRVFNPKLFVLQSVFSSYWNFECSFWDFLRPKIRNIKSIRSN